MVSFYRRHYSQVMGKIIGIISSDSFTEFFIALQYAAIKRKITKKTEAVAGTNGPENPLVNPVKFPIKVKIGKVGPYKSQPS